MLFQAQLTELRGMVPIDSSNEAGDTALELRVGGMVFFDRRRFEDTVLRGGYTRNRDG